MNPSDAGAEARREALREANRIHCRQTRERKKRQEEMLREEANVLEICRSIVESGPDLFSVHDLNSNAQFRFLSESFCEWLPINPEDILGQPLYCIIDPRDMRELNSAVVAVLNSGTPNLTGDRSGSGVGAGASSSSAAAAGGPGASAAAGGFSGCSIDVRITRFGITRLVNMTITIGSQGLIIVTRPRES